MGESETERYCDTTSRDCICFSPPISLHCQITYGLGSISPILWVRFLQITDITTVVEDITDIARESANVIIV